ncbi:MAG: hypothetical protein AAF527_12205, partial [Pseudomonadota bacterium]
RRLALLAGVSTTDGLVSETGAGERALVAVASGAAFPLDALGRGGLEQMTADPTILAVFLSSSYAGQPGETALGAARLLGESLAAGDDLGDASNLLLAHVVAGLRVAGLGDAARRIAFEAVLARSFPRLTAPDQE